MLRNLTEIQTTNVTKHGEFAFFRFLRWLCVLLKLKLTHRLLSGRHLHFEGPLNNTNTNMKENIRKQQGRDMTIAKRLYLLQGRQDHEIKGLQSAKQNNTRRDPGQLHQRPPTPIQMFLNKNITPGVSNFLL